MNAAAIAIAPSRRIQFVMVSDLQPRLDSTGFVKGYLSDGGLSVVYGESNCGKTFFATDLGMHVALGLPWFGRKVQQGAVVYVAGEGGNGLDNRLCAWLQHHGHEDATVPFAIVRQSLDLCDSGADTAPLIEATTNLATSLEQPVRLVIVDTLARAINGGDENSAKDMGAVVSNADRIRAATGAHVMFVHHTGKDRANGARGHSSLRAAVDTEIEVAKGEGFSTATATKQRDHETGAAFNFKLYVVEVGLDAEGERVTSCVVEPSDEPVPQKIKKAPRLAPQPQRALSLLKEAVQTMGKPVEVGDRAPKGTLGVLEEDWRNQCHAARLAAGGDDAQRKAFDRAYSTLTGRTLVAAHGGWVWLP